MTVHTTIPALETSEVVSGFDTFAAFQTWNLTKGTIEAGKIVRVGGVSYAYSAGATEISGLNDWVLSSPFASIYSNRAAAIAASIPAAALTVAYIGAGEVLSFRRDGSGVALTTADGATWSPAGNANVHHYGAADDETSDETSAMNAMLGDLGYIALKADRTYHTTGLTLTTGQKILGVGGDTRPTIKLMDAANAHVITATDANDIHIENVIVDGNQANQTNGTSNNWRGIYLVGNFARPFIKSVIVNDAVDHGLFLSDASVTSNNAGQDGIVQDCEVHNCGSAAHIAAGGAGGSGFAGGHYTTRWDNCLSTGNNLNGMKTGGTHIACISRGNGQGYEGGFNANTDKKRLTNFIACHALDNDGDGGRFLGEYDLISWEGGSIVGNGVAGLTFANVVAKATVSGVAIGENGKDATHTPAGTSQKAGIAILSDTGTTGEISIDACEFFDEQGTATQTRHIYISDTVANVNIGDTNRFDDAVEKILIEVVADDSPITIAPNPTLEPYGRDMTTTTRTGDTANTIMKTMTAPDKRFPRGQKFSITAAGTYTGTAGSKILRMYLDATSAIAINNSAAGSWMIEATLISGNGTDWYLVGTGTHFGAGTTTNFRTSINLSTGSDLDITLRGQLGDAADTITITSLDVS